VAGDFTDPHMLTGFAPSTLQNLAASSMSLTQNKRTCSNEEGSRVRVWGRVDALTRRPLLNRGHARCKRSTRRGAWRWPTDSLASSARRSSANFGDGRSMHTTPDPGGFSGTLKGPRRQTTPIDGLGALASARRHRRRTGHALLTPDTTGGGDEMHGEFRFS